MKRLGRTNRPFYRVVAVDSRGARDGRVLEYLGHYDPMVRDTHARAILQAERIDYWLSVGARPSDKVSVLIKKYGTNGTHRNEQKAALENLKTVRQQVPAATAARSSKTDQSEEGAEPESETNALETAAQES
jgi:small subunit ribosomal protein S16